MDAIIFGQIEEKWQRKWAEKRIFKARDNSKKQKFFVMEMFPYPSSTLLHMGHVRNYAIGDVIARFKRMQGYNVLYPMGYDSFGLPAENAAKKEGIHPKTYTENAIKKIMEYQKALGNSYDWDRTIATHEPVYYRWNQYFFLKFLEKGLVYRKKAPVNWCPSCKSVLANEEVVNGCCWRHEDTVVEAKELDQWFLKTTVYAEQLLEGLHQLQWSDRIKHLQRNWIGKSQGVLIDFPIKGSNRKLQVFTTRPDTIFGVTFVVVSPKHAFIDELAADKAAVEAFARKTQNDEERGKEGLFLGSYVINPFTNEPVPIYAANFVVAEYGTGAVMAVPAHDSRDFDFAKKYNLPIKTVIQPAGQRDFKVSDAAFVDEGVLVESGQFTGMQSTDAISKIAGYAEKNRLGKTTTQYKLRDWLISRQRYWGTPIPIVYCDECGTVPVPEKELPVRLPDSVDFKVDGNPLAAVKSWVETKCPKCKGKAKRETDTMGGFVDSSWYFLRYCSPKETKQAFKPEAVSYWMPVDQYIGGIEHAVGHLIYSRFWTKALRDLGIIKIDEPFTRLFNQGIVYKDGHKMSKSFGNIVTQTEISSKYGIDAARVYVISVADPESDMEWSDEGIEGVHRFINRLVSLYQEPPASSKNDKDKPLQHKLNTAIEHITAEMGTFKLNTAILHLMDLVNYVHKWKSSISAKTYKAALKTICVLASPFMPHTAEECWEKFGKGFCSVAKWPAVDEAKINPYYDSAEALVEQTMSDIRDIMRLVKIEKCSKVTLFIADGWKHDFYTAMKAQLAKTKNAGDIIKVLMASDLREHGSDIAKLVPKLVQDPSRILAYSMSRADEAKAFKENKAALEKELGCTVDIIPAEKSAEQKARNAWPGKPAIVVA